MPVSVLHTGQSWQSDSREVYQTGRWEALGQGARWAYQDYQGSRAFPPATDASLDSNHFSFTYGNTATFVMDLFTVVLRTRPASELRRETVAR